MHKVDCTLFWLLRKAKSTNSTIKCYQANNIKKLLIIQFSTLMTCFVLTCWLSSRHQVSSEKNQKIFLFGWKHFWKLWLLMTNANHRRSFFISQKFSDALQNLHHLPHIKLTEFYHLEKEEEEVELFEQLCWNFFFVVRFSNSRQIK